MTVRVFIESAKNDREMVEWAVMNCKSFLYSIATYYDLDGRVEIELFFATEQDAVIFNLLYL